MSSVILKGFGDGHSQSPAKEMAQEKLSEVKMRFEKKQLQVFLMRGGNQERSICTFQRRK